MPRLRLWLRDHVLNFLRDPGRKSHPTSKHTSFRNSIIVSAPFPLGSLAIDLTTPFYPPPTSFSAQDLTEPLPSPQSTSMIIEDAEEEDQEQLELKFSLPPTHLPEIAEQQQYTEEAEFPTTRQRPTRNFSRRFSRRFSSFSSHSASSYASSEAKRMSQMSAVSTMSKGDDEWGSSLRENRLSRRWSGRMSGAWETHTRGFTPLGIA